MTTSISVTVPEIFRAYVSQALVRLAYLHPGARFDFAEDTISVEYDGKAPIEADEVTYQLYREKIYQESLPMRKLMYMALLS
ncbi:MAG TPA: hypothetical protein VL133_08770 [Devosia sp.]|nr:hypothetical protein [Devosia sp.]